MRRKNSKQKIKHLSKYSKHRNNRIKVQLRQTVVNKKRNYLSDRVKSANRKHQRKTSPRKARHMINRTASYKRKPRARFKRSKLIKQKKPRKSVKQKSQRLIRTEAHK